MLGRPCLFALLLTVLPTTVLAAEPVRFREDVAPILARKCLGCHNDKKAAGGLNMATFALLKRGGKMAKAEILIAGDPENSELVLSVQEDAAPRMPYKLPPLTDAEIKTLARWVAEGAKFDGASEVETQIASLVDPLKGLPQVKPRAEASDPVAALEFSPDDKMLASAVGRKVVLFDAASGKTIATLGDHPGPVSSVAFTADGKTLVAAGGRPGMFGAVTVWDLASNAKRKEARAHADAILTAAIALDGKTLATAGYDRAVLLWDLADLKPVRTLKDHTDAVHAVVFSPDGKTLASAAADRTVKLWNVADGVRLGTLPDATAELYAVAFSPDGSTVFAAGVDRSIRAWNVRRKEMPLIASTFAHDAPVIRLAVSADGKTLVSSGEDRAVKLWDARTLSPRSPLPEQPDWPQAIALDRAGTRLAVGRHDGSIQLYDASKGTPTLALRSPAGSAPKPPAKPELVRNASLNLPSPRTATRGATVRMVLTGNGVGNAGDVLVDPGLKAKPIRPVKPDPNRLEIDLTIAPDAPLGRHAIGVVTPLGVPPRQPFFVEAYPATAETEPNDKSSAVSPITLPATLTGTIASPGDVDHLRVRVKKGESLLFAMSAKPLGSSLLGMMTLLDEQGRTIAEAAAFEGARDPILSALAPADGIMTLRVTDLDFGGSGNHFYRIAASTGAAAPTPFPLPLSAELAVGPQIMEALPNETPDKATPITVPGVFSGRVERAGDIDHVRFEAKKGQRLVVELQGRRLKSPIDSAIAILDASGRPVPRARLRPVTQTEVAFRDHASSGTGIRLTTWNNLAINDVVLIGREVTRIFDLPKNPDDDCQFWGEQGQRIGLLGTTPEHHPMGQPIYKVEIHPPGASFPTGGAPPVTLDYRNDDAGPSIGKDSLLLFDPPVDGTYVVQVQDVRGLGGTDFGYHLLVRRPQPDFRVTVSPEDINIPRGGTTLATVNVTRLDEFDGPITVDCANLPPGVTAASAVVEAGMTTALLAFSADAAAPAFSAPTWSLTAHASTDNSPGQELRHEIDPGGPNGGRITITPAPNLTIVAKPRVVRIQPGRDVTMTLDVVRSPAFAGRVPIDVRNLPHGVRVLNIGLNGVLVTESQTSRTITLHADPWVAPMERPFYAVARAETAGTEDSSAPIQLIIEPASAQAAK